MPYKSYGGVKRTVPAYVLWEVQEDKKNVKKIGMYIDWPFDKDDLDWEETRPIVSGYSTNIRITPKQHLPLHSLEILPPRATERLSMFQKK